MTGHEPSGSATVTDVGTSAPQGRWLSLWETGLLIAAGAGLLSFGWVGMGLNQYLGQVDPSQDAQGVTYHGQPVDRTWVLLVVWMSLTLVAATGLPRRNGKGSLTGAIFQGLGGLIAAAGMGVAEVISNVFRFSGAGDRCTYPSCWPLQQQTAALLGPGVLAGLSMVVMAFLVRLLPWWVRAAVPVVLWLAALVAQHLVWGTWLPIFQAPPR
ncbi:hypothetical protein [Kribbella sp. NPDC051718]|uniref:hypothetical protein n=1 Tax=Kribbella sp. NPDC051718 TaxID=3155168 RepID=UPI0034147689